jgi:aliphatic nitrilase
VSQVYAAEGQAFVVAACGTVSPAMVELMCDTPVKRELLKAGGGAAMIYAPDGRPLCEPLPPDAEGLLIADLDLGAIAIAKSAADPVGHYARADVARVVFNPEPLARVERAGARGTSSRRFTLDAPEHPPAEAPPDPDARVLL